MASFTRDTNAPRFVNSGQVAVQRQPVEAPDFSQAFNVIGGLIKKAVGRKGLEGQLGQLEDTEQQVESMRDATDKLEDIYKPEVIAPILEKVRAKVASGNATPAEIAGLRHLESVNVQVTGLDAEATRIAQQRTIREAQAFSAKEVRRIAGQNPETAGVILRLATLGTLGDALAGTLQFEKDATELNAHTETAKNVGTMLGIPPDTSVPDILRHPDFDRGYRLLQEAQESQMKMALHEQNGKLATAEAQTDFTKSLDRNVALMYQAMRGFALQAQQPGADINSIILSFEQSVDSIANQAKKQYAAAGPTYLNQINPAVTDIKALFAKTITGENALANIKNYNALMLEESTRRIFLEDPAVRDRFVVMQQLATIKDLPLAQKFGKMLESGNFVRMVMKKFKYDNTAVQNRGPMPDLMSEWKSASQEERQGILQGMEELSLLAADTKNFDKLSPEMQEGLRSVFEGVVGTSIPEELLTKPILQGIARVAGHSPEAYINLVAGSGAEDSLAAQNLFVRAINQVSSEATKATLSSLDGIRIVQDGTLTGRSTPQSAPLAAQAIRYKYNRDGNIVARYEPGDLIINTEQDMKIRRKVQELNAGPLKDISRMVRAQGHMEGTGLEPEKHYIGVMAKLMPLSALNNLPNFSSDITDTVSRAASVEAIDIPTPELRAPTTVINPVTVDSVGAAPPESQTPGDAGAQLQELEDRLKQQMEQLNGLRP